MNDILTIHNLTKYYGSLLAVDHISMRVQEGEVFGFLGPNGAGKTTTIRILVGLTAPSEGTATIKGYDIRSDLVKVKRCVGVVPETSNLYHELTVWENLQFMAGMYHVPKGERRARIGSLLETFGLTDRKRAKFGSLSKGFKRRVTIAAALIHRPSLLFLDEPTSGLDVMSARSLRQFVKELRELGVTVFLTTHYIEEADQLCDRIAIIVQGRIIAVDTPERLKAGDQDTAIIEVAFTAPVASTGWDALQGYGVVEVKGNRVWLRVREVAPALTAVTRFADDRGLEIMSLNTVKPRLEDAFVSLTGVASEEMLMEKERRGGGA
jgi:ABC-2 type transport system ATP-binding protein